MTCLFHLVFDKLLPRFHKCSPQRTFQTWRTDFPLPTDLSTEGSERCIIVGLPQWFRNSLGFPQYFHVNLRTWTECVTPYHDLPLYLSQIRLPVWFLVCPPPPGHHFDGRTDSTWKRASRNVLQKQFPVKSTLRSWLEHDLWTSYSFVTLESTHRTTWLYNLGLQFLRLPFLPHQRLHCHSVLIRTNGQSLGTF